MRNLFLISIILCITAGNVGGQSKRNSTPAKPASQANILQFDEADALFGKRKAKPTNSAHDKYANQEVSYRQGKRQTTNKRGVVFEPNDEPLWAKQNKRRKSSSTRAKNHGIEIENDETHLRTRKAARTETVNNNESLRTVKTRRRKN